MDGINHAISYKQNGLLYQSVGIRQFAPGAQAPDLSLNGFVHRGQGAITAHNLLSPSGIGSLADTEFISLIPLGVNALPVANQDLCVAHDGTLIPGYKRTQDVQNIQKFSAAFKSRGTRLPAFPVFLVDQGPVKGSFTSAFYDDGAEGNGTASGGVGILQVLTPTGTAASGTVGLGGLPADADSFTLTINSVAYVYTFKTTPTAAGHVKIGATAAATLQSLFQAMVGSPVGVLLGNVFTGTTPIDNTQCSVGLPGATTIALTAVNTGTGPNAWTLVKSGVNLTVSGATMAGGVAGETATIVIQSATTSGGAYTTFCTFTSDFTKRKGELVTVPVGTTINQFLKTVITLSGSTMNWAARVAFGRFFAGQA